MKAQRYTFIFLMACLAGASLTFVGCKEANKPSTMTAANHLLCLHGEEKSTHTYANATPFNPHTHFCNEEKGPQPCNTMSNESYCDPSQGEPLPCPDGKRCMAGRLLQN
ncbi:MAG: hypothetical protein EP343_07520 [Deltaproteobacteria bacterium]|nr:MAG: hypothetical protein EP343_07520 [Deltaproteobacteria bacterium]